MAGDGSTKVYTVTVSVAASSSKDITQFAILGVSGTINGTSIAVTLPSGTNVTSLIPSIGITGISITPANGVARDFTNPVAYTVTAADISTKVYTVTVTVAPSNTKEITDFVIQGVHGIINNTSIALTLPAGTDVKNLIPAITITGTSVNPQSGVAQDFTNPVNYTVTAADNSMKVYTATVTVAPSTAKDIVKFSLLGIDGQIQANNIGVILPDGTDVRSLTPTINITGVSVNPLSGASQNFSTAVPYVVTAADNSTHTYTVTVDCGPFASDGGVVMAPLAPAIPSAPPPDSGPPPPDGGPPPPDSGPPPQGCIRGP
jgi:hypothetical protein